VNPQAVFIQIGISGKVALEAAVSPYFRAGFRAGFQSEKGFIKGI
jgi:hypothetical protein